MIEKFEVKDKYIKIGSSIFLPADIHIEYVRCALPVHGDKYVSGSHQANLLRERDVGEVCMRDFDLRQPL
jgi:hypothetical protein